MLPAVKRQYYSTATSHFHRQNPQDECVTNQHHHGFRSWFQRCTIIPSLPATPKRSYAIQEKTMTTFTVSFQEYLRKMCAIFFLLIMVVANGCDGHKVLHRVERDAQPQNSALASSNNPSSHSTNLSPPITSYASSPSSTHAPPSSKNYIPGAPPPSSVGLLSSKAGGSNPIPDSESKAQLISTLISTLEKLSVLQQSNSSCVRLEKIVHKIIEDPSSLSSRKSSSTSSSSVENTFGVYLYFQEILQPSLNASNTRDSGNANITGDNSPVNERKNGSSDASVFPVTCISDPAIEILVAKGNRHGVDGGHFGTGNEDGANNGTAGESSVDENLQTGVYGILQTGKLSRTQIVVISTCSAIIGMFFLVAGFLRIRNYIKRARMEQALAKRPKFRSCSVALRNPTQSMEQLRRDSLASKTSHQNSVSTKGSNGSQTNGSSQENSSASSPRHDPDTTPLLVITRAPPNEETTPTESHSSLQYIDEEAPRKKAMRPTALVKNGTQDGGYTIQFVPDNTVQGQPAATVRRGGSLKGTSRSTSRGGDSVHMSKQNGQPTHNKGEGNVNPSFSSGSLGYQLISSVEDSGITSGDGTKLEGDNMEEKMQTKGSYHQLGTVDTDDVNKGKHLDVADGEKLLGSNLGKADGLPYHDNSKTHFPSGRADNLQTSAPQISLADTGTGLTSSVADSSFPRWNTGDTYGNDSESPMLENCNFGLCQSDTSLSSECNQGKEFNGQREYRPSSCTHLPDPCNDVASNTKFDNDNCDIEMTNVNNEKTISSVNKEGENDKATTIQNPRSSTSQHHEPQAKGANTGAGNGGQLTLNCPDKTNSNIQITQPSQQHPYMLPKDDHRRELSNSSSEANYSLTSSAIPSALPNPQGPKTQASVSHPSQQGQPRSHPHCDTPVKNIPNQTISNDGSQNVTLSPSGITECPASNSSQSPFSNPEPVNSSQDSGVRASQRKAISNNIGHNTHEHGNNSNSYYNTNLNPSSGLNSSSYSSHNHKNEDKPGRSSPYQGTESSALNNNEIEILSLSDGKTFSSPSQEQIRNSKNETTCEQGENTQIS